MDFQKIVNIDISKIEFNIVFIFEYKLSSAVLSPFRGGMIALLLYFIVYTEMICFYFEFQFFMNYKRIGYNEFNE